MNKGFAILEKYLMGPMGKLASFRIVRAIMGAGLASIPFTIVGSMFLVFNILPLTFPGLETLFNATFFKFSDLYMLANKCTMGILSLYFFSPFILFSLIPHKAKRPHTLRTTRTRQAENPLNTQD